MENRKGLWICIEGADFTGKGEQCKRLLGKLVSLNEDNVIVYTHEPTARANEIKRKLLFERDASSDRMRMTELYVEDRRWNEENVIKPILRVGGIVLSNRHKYSTDAYQSAQGVPIDELRKMQIRAGVGTPDVSVILDLTDDERRRRMNLSGKTFDKFERDLEFQEKVAAAYKEIHALSKSKLHDRDYLGDLFLISGEGKPEEVFSVLWQQVKPYYDLWIERKS